jgi:hypothetical protein
MSMHEHCRHLNGGMLLSTNVSTYKVLEKKLNTRIIE